MSIEAQSATAPGQNGVAITSLVFGILSWIFAIALLILNVIVLPLITVATVGVGSFLYICTVTLGCLSPLGWLVGLITGYVAKNQIKQTGSGNMGMANAGIIMSLLGLGLTLLACIAIVILSVTGASFLMDSWGQFGIPDY